ncbi:copper homeostasis periplasmic binding protein CopC [Glacieibacterium sp.]|uniref:copper homeostasis periplasmic binding protein CopC n=1 Tax=Glacieibacterium sp. TaxID=2860237 RepID=UPI003AFF638B
MKSYVHAMIAAALLSAAPVLAHPKVASATPAAGATVAAPATIELHLTETLMPKLSGATLTMTGMPGMADHPPMPIKSTSRIGSDGKTLMVVPKSKLAAGSYRVDWHVVSSDTHRVTGTHDFTVQ